MEAIFKKEPHNPPHLYQADAIYMLTASTYQRKNFMQSDERKVQWKEAFFKAADLYGWSILAWVVLDNHYHALAKSSSDSLNLSKFISSYHKFTALQWNRSEHQTGRMVWYNYWDTCVRSEKDYLARLKYVFWNPVKHSLVRNPEDYPFSNYEAYVDVFSGNNIEEVNDVPEF